MKDREQIQQSEKQCGNYIAPFTKLSPTDSRSAIEKRILQLKHSGITSMVLEYGNVMGGMNRVTPFDAKLWKRLQWVSEICQEHQMTFLIQDAAPFPTGAANGLLSKKEYAHLNKTYLDERHLDVCGPAPGSTLLINQLIHCSRGKMDDAAYMKKFMKTEPKLLGVVALPWTRDGLQTECGIDLTKQVRDGKLIWDVPDGQWRVFCLIETPLGGRENFINLLDRDSVKLLIDNIHRPTYEHLKDQLGKTWLGFFYDEPEVGNTPSYPFDARIGSMPMGSGMQMVLPWSKDLPELLKKLWGNAYMISLPFLWYEGCGDAFRKIRYQYMDLISEQICRNYNHQVHAFCQEHGILYTGHNLEDENSHARLGCGPVHYFRMQEGQDISGIDLVGGQIMPGKDRGITWYGAIDGDGEFYHYCLAKLASSAAHIQPNKKGRAMAEDFALYGAVADTKLRKFVIDHLMVNGINHFVHADAFGEIQNEYLQKLNQYTNRMCHLLQNIQPKMKAAVLYHAEAEWAGACQYSQKPARELAQHQISYDIVPADIFHKRDFYRTDTSKGLAVNNVTYQILIVPNCLFLPTAVAEFVKEAAQTGFPVFFVDAFPEKTIEDLSDFVPHNSKAVPLNCLAEQVMAVAGSDVSTSSPEPYLRTLRFSKDGAEYLFLHNEKGVGDMELDIQTDLRGPIFRIDALEDTVSMVPSENGKFHLHLHQYESALLCTGTCISEQVTACGPQKIGKQEVISGTWSVELIRSGKQPKKTLSLPALENLHQMEQTPSFAGTAEYHICFTRIGELPTVLDLGTVYGPCNVELNGKNVGCRIAPPYCFDISDAVQRGKNQLTVKVQVLDTQKIPKGFETILASLMATVYSALEPAGLLGPATTR